jgi:hypothetical protein
MKEFIIGISILLIAFIFCYGCMVLNEIDEIATKTDEERRKRDVEEDPSLLN